MIYIVTYATHSERYFEILKHSSPDIIVLGYGKKWNGFSDKVNAVVEFCKSKSPDDIVCFVDGFDSIILSSKEEILEKYKTFNAPLVFSNDIPNTTPLHKYIKDKIFYGRCNEYALNSGLYIGTSKSIIEFWGNIKHGDDDQVYATKMCRKLNNIVIDKEYKIFYNYFSQFNYKINNNRLVIQNNNPCIISCPGRFNINHILDKLGFTNLPDVKRDYNLIPYAIKNYGKEFISEIIALIVIIFIFFYIKDISTSFKLIIIVIAVLLEYELFIKNLDVDISRKILYLIIDAIHISFIFFIYYLIFNYECNIQKLLFLNIVFFIHILLFFYFKRCIITIISNKVIDVEESNVWKGLPHRLFYFSDLKSSYDSKNIINPSQAWIDGNRINIIIIILLNIYCLWKINKGTTCIRKNGYGKLDFNKIIRKFY
jgi:hypothetical protein